MFSALTPYREKKLADFWDVKTPTERLGFILDHEELLWALELITQAELKVVHATSVSNRNYVIQREIQPFFASINLREPFKNQIHSQKLKAALNAALFESGERKWPYFS